ncbi:hypothetical protein SASPL_146528 [Salvia splendens]|uniref:Myb/SANT-like domain-containing protein n=1 Tax=Salvia splendens TaxID=180675 RepID=A0A8X8Z5T4_SALSN|nr:hypothetical protein SASPL_146528 [Salvia splendens]
MDHCRQTCNPEKSRRKFKKGDRTRRIWLHREEEILAASLVKLVALWWKSDNGFRTRYLQKCEDGIRQEFPTSDIKGTPHVVSKITSWKTSYTSLRNILERTGVGFSSNGDYKIDIDDEQWEHVVKVDPIAKYMRHKSWPLWETWKCIFGKDCATGARAENIFIAAALPTPEEVELPKEEAVADQVSSGNINMNTVPTKFVGEKRKARLAVFEKLGEVEGLTLAQRYRLCNILGDKPQRHEVFTGMPTPARLGYLLALLEES